MVKLADDIKLVCTGGGGNSSLNFIDHVLLKKTCHQNTQNMILLRINVFFARSARKHCMPLCKLAEWINVVDTQEDVV